MRINLFRGVGVASVKDPHCKFKMGNKKNCQPALVLGNRSSHQNNGKAEHGQPNNCKPNNSALTVLKKNYRIIKAAHFS